MMRSKTSIKVIFCTLMGLMALPGFLPAAVMLQLPGKPGQHGRTGDSPDMLLVHGNSVEKIKLGRSMKEVYAMYPAKRIERVLIYDEKGSYEKIEILNKDRSEVLFFIEPDCNSVDSSCIIRRINITSNIYHTRSNLRVGKYYVDLVKTGEKFIDIAWFEGNLVIRAKETGLSYVLQTNSIPKPWYVSMDRETLPDSTKIIGMMVTGKNLKGMSYLEVDSLNKKIQADQVVHNADLALYKTDQAAKKKDFLAARKALAAVVSKKRKSVVIRSLIKHPGFTRTDSIKAGSSQAVLKPAADAEPDSKLKKINAAAGILVESADSIKARAKP